MKTDTVWGVLPVFILKSTNEYGRAKGPFIFIPNPDNPRRDRLAHEKFHVKQWYAYWGGVTAFGGVCASLFGYFAPATLDPVAAQFTIATLLFLPYLLGVSIWNETSWYRECAAFGESLRALGSMNRLRDFADTLAHHPAYANDTRSLERCIERIEAKALSGALF